MTEGLTSIQMKTDLKYLLPASGTQCALLPLRALKSPWCELCAVPEAHCLLASPEKAWMPHLRPPLQPITLRPVRQQMTRLSSEVLMQFADTRMGGESSALSW